MFPLLFIPGSGSGECAAATSGQQLTTCYDLRCSEEFGCGASNVTIQQVKVGWRTVELQLSDNATDCQKPGLGGEASYRVTITTVKVMADMTVCQVRPISIMSSINYDT